MNHPWKPGPWSVYEPTNRPPGHTFGINAADDRAVCVSGETPDEGGILDKVDAQLIAAAPTMFDLLRQVKERVLSTIAPESDADAELFAAIDEVLELGKPSATEGAEGASAPKPCQASLPPTHIAVTVGESERLYCFASVDEEYAIEESRELCLGASEPWAHTYVLTAHLPPRRSVTRVEGSKPKPVESDSE